MDKPATKSKKKISKFLSFQNLPFSPRGRDRRPDLNSQKLKNHQNRGFSGPIVSMIPADARRKSKNFETQEPTSPKISCMGQIKHKNNIPKMKHASLPKEFTPQKVSKAGPVSKMKKPSGIKRMFSSGTKAEGIGGNRIRKPPTGAGAPNLGQMRRFASSRETFANFDWTTARISPAEDRGFYSDDERGYSDGEDDVIIPFSAPILTAIGGAGLDLEHKKEINLWKRRTMAQPAPLKLNHG